MRLFMSREVLRVASRKSRVLILRIRLIKRYCSEWEHIRQRDICQVFFYSTRAFFLPCDRFHWTFRAVASVTLAITSDKTVRRIQSGIDRATIQNSE
jgi:hypothetical protein